MHCLPSQGPGPSVHIVQAFTYQYWYNNVLSLQVYDTPHPLHHAFQMILTMTDRQSTQHICDFFPQACNRVTIILDLFPNSIQLTISPGLDILYPAQVRRVRGGVLTPPAWQVMVKKGSIHGRCVGRSTVVLQDPLILIKSAYENIIAFHYKMRQDDLIVL